VLGTAWLLLGTVALTILLGALAANAIRQVATRRSQQSPVRGNRWQALASPVFATLIQPRDEKIDLTVGDSAAWRYPHAAVHEAMAWASGKHSFVVQDSLHSVFHEGFSGSRFEDCYLPIGHASFIFCRTDWPNSTVTVSSRPV
jgi:hypothetical protein